MGYITEKKKPIITIAEDKFYGIKQLIKYRSFSKWNTCIFRFSSYRKDLNINDEVRLIHISILNYISLEISPILQILNVPSVLLDEVEAYDETKIDYYLYILQKELKMNM